MGKRSASGTYAGLLRVLRATISAKSNQADTRPHSKSQLIHQLERRVMFSTGTAVDLQWHGSTVEAYQNQYVVETEHLNAFEKLAHAKGFTQLTSLGGGGYYSFNSDLPVSTLGKIASQTTRAFKILTPNSISHIATTSTDDPLLPKQWYLGNTGQLESYDYNGDQAVTPYDLQDDPAASPTTTPSYPSPPYPNENQTGTVGDDIGVSSAWDITTGSTNVVVAILDTGIDTTQPDLTANLFSNPLDTAANGEDGDGYPNDVHGFNFVDNDSIVDDDNGHGTEVAGIIGAAGNNGVGVSGVDWGVSLLPVKIADSGGAVADANEIAGINYCVMLKDDGINIVAMNESIGGPEFPINVLTTDAITRAGKAGILDIVAAGNSSQNLDSTFSTPAKNSLANSNVITVAAVDNQFKLANFSNFGAASVNVAAPGVRIFTTEMDDTFGYADGNGTGFTQIDENGAELDGGPGFASPLSGTSFSAPIVTGVIALEAAANPNASPAQLKQALLDGVTYDPALASSNGTPAKVSTSGVVNAFNSVRDILNDFSTSNTTHGGNWFNFYGSQGAYVVGESTTFPSFATVTQSGGSPVVLANSTKLTAALQRVSDTTQRISAYEAAAGSESVDINFTDGNAHQVAIYLADLDNKKRTENISILDTATGSVLDSRTISKFNKGEYLVYDLRGDVTVSFTNQGGPSAVYSGIFFDAPPVTPTAYVGTDTSTAGANWRLQYGSQGAIEAGDTSQYPSYLTSFTVPGATQTVVFKPTTQNTNALQRVSSVNSNLEAYYSTTTSMDFNLDFNDTLAHVVTLYVADYDKKQRQERIEALGPTGDILVTTDISNFTKGQFVSFNVTGDTTFRVINTGPTTAVLSGIFFDAPFGENSSFVTTDTTTHGDWLQSQFGLTKSFIVGVNFPIVDDSGNSDISIVGATQKILTANSANPAALVIDQPVSPLKRIASYFYTTTSMTLDYNPGDLLVHTVALYFADYENFKRTEAVTITNGSTNTVLSHQILSNFSKGKYLLFEVTGPVLITINNGAYPNAVLSGVFTN